MMTKKDLKKWLENKDRNFEQGVILFKALCRKKVIEKYGKFFDTEEPKVEHFSLLMNVLSKVPISPEELKENTEEKEVQKTTDIKAGKVKDLTNLQPGKVDFENFNFDKIEGFEAEKAVIKTFTPEIAALHNKMKDESLTDEQRAILRDDLDLLEEKRRIAWDAINAGNPENAEEKPKSLEELKYLKRTVDDKIRKTRLALGASAKPETIAKHQERLEEQLEEQREIEEAIIKATS